MQIEDAAFQQAVDVLWRAGGEDLLKWMGRLNRVPVSEEAQESAARVLIQLQGQWPGTLSEEEKIRIVIDEVKAQGYEAWWAVVGDRAATIPAKRVELIQFIEGKTGRPLPLESEDDPA